MTFGETILKYKEELFRDLNTLLSIESVDGEKDDECDRALRFVLGRAADFGLLGERVTDKSAHVQSAAEEGFAECSLTLTLCQPATTGA